MCIALCRSATAAVTRRMRVLAVLALDRSMAAPKSLNLDSTAIGCGKLVFPLCMRTAVSALVFANIWRLLLLISPPVSFTKSMVSCMLLIVALL